MLASLASPPLGSLGALGDEPPPPLTCPAGKYPLFSNDGRLLGCFADPAEQPPAAAPPPWKPPVGLILGVTLTLGLVLHEVFRSKRP